MNNDFLADLYASNMIIIPRSIFLRKKQELTALEKLKFKNDFFSKYNLAIRHLFLFFLDNGYDIPNPKVHFIFRIFCLEVLKKNKIEVNKIIAGRHKMKYKNIEPTLIVLEKLSNVIDEIKFCNNQKQII